MLHMKNFLCGGERRNSNSDMSLEALVSPGRRVLQRMLKPAKSPTTVLTASHECELQVFLARAITRTYLALSERDFLNWHIGLANCRAADRYWWDPYNALALACAFVDLIVHSCSEQCKANYFHTNAGKFVVVALFVLSVKFSKSDAFRLGGDGCNCLTTTRVVYSFMFGGYRATNGVKKSFSDLVFETEGSLMAHMGGRLYSLSQSCTSTRVEYHLEEAILASSGREEHTLLLTARNVAVVYALSMHCIDFSSEAPSIAAAKAGMPPDALSRVALLIATQLMVLMVASPRGGAEGLPQSLLPFFQEDSHVVLTVAVSVLKYCCVQRENVPLCGEAKRDVHLGIFFEPAAQLKAAACLMNRVSGS